LRAGFRLAGARVRVNVQRPPQRHTWLTFACSSALLMASAAGQLYAGIHASAASAPTPKSVSLRPGDVPGFTPIDPSTDSFADPNNDDVKAWALCAAADPILSALDTQSAADVVSQVFGKGTDLFGTPALSVASIVFGAGNRPQAASSYALMAGTMFQRCFAATLDANDQAEGLSTPEHPSTVTHLGSPRLGTQSTAFRIDQVLSVEGVTTTAATGFTLIQTNALLAILITAAVDSSFPEPTRITTAQLLATRMGTPLVPTPIPTASASASPSSSTLPPLQLPPCTSGAAGDEQSGIDYGNKLNAFLAESPSSPPLEYVTGTPDLTGLFEGYLQTPVITNAAWMAGFFDTIAEPPTPSGDRLTELIADFGGITNDYKERAGAPEPTDHFQYPAFYGAIDCALSSGTTTQLLSNDIVNQRYGMGVNLSTDLGGQTEDALVVALLLEPRACFGLVEHLSAAAFRSAVTQVNTAGMAAIATTALQAVAPSGLPEISNIIPLYPRFDSGYEAGDPNHPVWSTGDIATDEITELVFAADQFSGGIFAADGPASVALGYLLNDVPESDPNPSGASQLNYSAWLTIAAFLYYSVDLPYAERAAANFATGVPIPQLPDFSRMTINEPQPGTVPGGTALTIPQLEQESPSEAQTACQSLNFFGSDEENVMARVLVAAQRVVGPNGTPITDSQISRQSNLLGYGSLGDLADVFWRLFASDVADLPFVHPAPTPKELCGFINMSSQNGVFNVLDGSHMAVLVAGGGFAPNNPVTIVGESTPVHLADAWADSTGAFTIPVVVAGRLTAGSHTLVATGRAPDGKARILSVAIQIVDLSPSGVPWVAILAPAAAVVVIALGAALLWRSRRRRTLAGAPRAA
jgi:hypothetical protein